MAGKCKPYLVVLSVLALVLLALLQSPVPVSGGGGGSCEGMCGGKSGDCWCDAACFVEGDCCDNVCDWCENHSSFTSAPANQCDYHMWGGACSPNQCSGGDSQAFCSCDTNCLASGWCCLDLDVSSCT